jgi:hypothetical protein
MTQRLGSPIMAHKFEGKMSRRHSIRSDAQHHINFMISSQGEFSTEKASEVSMDCGSAGWSFAGSGFEITLNRPGACKRRHPIRTSFGP